MAFPDTSGDPGNLTHIIGNKVWNWDGEKWILQSIKVGAPAFAAVNPVQVENLATTTTYSLDAETLESITTDDDGNSPGGTVVSSTSVSSGTTSNTGGSY